MIDRRGKEAIRDRLRSSIARFTLHLADAHAHAAVLVSDGRWTDVDHFKNITKLCLDDEAYLLGLVEADLAKESTCQPG